MSSYSSVIFLSCSRRFLAERFWFCWLAGLIKALRESKKQTNKKTLFSFKESLESYRRWTNSSNSISL